MSIVGDIRVNAYVADGSMSPDSRYAPVLRALGTDGSGRVLVAETRPGSDEAGPAAAGTIVGTVMLQTWPTAGNELITGPDEAEIRALAVLPGAQGRGVGAKLLRAVTEAAEAAGIRHLLLQTQPEMRAAQRLYQRAGFVRLPERDRTPVPGVHLLAFGLRLDQAEAAEAAARSA